MKFVPRLVLGTFAVVVISVLMLRVGSREAVPGIVMLVLVVALLLAWLAGRSVAKPLVALSEAARDIAAGDTPRFPRSGIPEVDALAEALRRMHGDLAERGVELVQQRAGATAIVDAMTEGVLASDASGIVVLANPAARRLLGYARDVELPALTALFRPRAARDAIIRVLSGEAVNDCEVELDDRTVSLNARPLNGQGAVVVMHDLTEIRRLETMRRDFVANVSHELKTPLTSIAGYADTLADPGIDAATRQQFLATILANARRMQRLVDDLLDLSRIESGRWTPVLAATDVARVARDAWTAFQGRAADTGVQLLLSMGDGATELTVDTEALTHILSNLYDNALRYAPQGSAIAVESGRSDGMLSISVRDSGPGILGEHLPRIFERFYRADPARARDAGGTGLGLAIVRHLVEAHGGRVEAESELQHGTIIRCWFPAPVPGNFDV
jgi:two-component system, OmpR family, phosphate regulon sensor histidine kinase PhoR